jgi:hypothetical protein
MGARLIKMTLSCSFFSSILNYTKRPPFPEANLQNNQSINYCVVVAGGAAVLPAGGFAGTSAGGSTVFPAGGFAGVSADPGAGGVVGAGSTAFGASG